MKNRIKFAIINVVIYFFIYSLTSFYYLSCDIEKWRVYRAWVFYTTSTSLQLFLYLIINDLNKNTHD